MTDKTKKIIAKEGLVLFPFLVALMIVMSTADYIPHTYYGTLFWAIVLGYPLIRFTIWAVRTLKEK